MLIEKTSRQAAPSLRRDGVAGRNRPAEEGGGEQAIPFADREETSSHTKNWKKNWRTVVKLSVMWRKAFMLNEKFNFFRETIGKNARILKCTSHIRRREWQQLVQLR